MWRPAHSTAWVFVAASVAAPSAGAFEIFTVGGDAACGFSSIQAAVDAAAAVPGEDYVWIASNQAYTGQHVVVQDQDVLIEGGFVDCSDFDIDTELTTVNGAGNGGGAVFAIRGTSHVLLTNLFIRGAERSGGAEGGGVDFVGAGGLTLQQSTVSLNSAGYGGGINFRGSGGHAELVIGHDTLVLSNTAATSGGGIRVEGDATLQVNSPNTLIAFNHALDGYGGGVEIIGPAIGNIGSPGYNGGAVIQFNEALRGGGISVNAGLEQGDDASLRLFTTDPQNPVQVSNNIAALTGGGIYLQPISDFDFGTYANSARLCAQQFRIDDNIAQEGSAIYSDTMVFNVFEYIGGVVELYSSTDTCRVPDGSPDAVACAPGIECNTMDRNISANTSNQPTPGATILVQNDGLLRIYGLRMRDNTGAHALRLFDTDADMRNALVTNNVFDSDLFLVEAEGDRGLVLRGTTIAGNVIGGSVVRAGNDSALGNLLIAQPGVPAYTVIDFPQAFFEYIVASDTTGLPLRDDLIEADAVFVDAGASDYHLATGSPGMDFAPAAGSADLDGNPRDIDVASVPNAFGPRDVGAYEAQLGCQAGTDTIFCNGFEG